MAKKVIGIILIVISVFTFLVSGIFLLVFGILGGTFGLIGNFSALQVEEGATVETVEGEIIYTDDSTTGFYYEVDGVPYVGELSMHNSAYTEGTLVTVEYDSSNPANFAVPELSGVFSDLGGIFGGVGIALGIVGLFAGVAMLVIGIVLIKKSKKA
ncbi:MAG: hypothetical protein J6A73_07980 [Lachnospiraceae bacterium]|nr:hypothetical protein [Lachnospiraceae bacterium]